MITSYVINEKRVTPNQLQTLKLQYMGRGFAFVHR